MRVILTGAARGLGLEVALEAVKREHQIAAVCRPQSDVTTLENLAKKYPRLVSIFKADVTNEKKMSEVASIIEKKWGALDGIINNAAIMIGRFESIDELDLDDVRQSFEVNVMGCMNVVKQCLPLVYKGKAPVVINVSSEAGTIVNAFSLNYPYSMSKTALNMFTERLRSHLADKDILAWAVHPGWMRTAMGGDSAPVDPAVTAWGFWEIMERKIEITSKISFIDATGRPMPL